ncbi:MAG: hypothetical protein ACREJB_03115 [Planctomycetaceae bacterium]
MNRLTMQQRKLLYLAGIVLLLIPIFLLGMPATAPTQRADEDFTTTRTTGGATESGGALARMRQTHELGESTLGNVDPTSSVLNFVLLGFRGIAVNQLWGIHEEQKKTKQWGPMRATTESIILLQPHYKKVWQYHGWDLAYNVSAEWDGVEDRYYWVKEGAKFLQDGVERNQKYPELPWEVGRITGQKIGRSDEWRQFRVFFLHDPDERFEGRADPAINPEEKDNYLVAKDWYTEANDREDQYDQDLMQDLLFRHYPARSQFDYADAMNREGQFDEVARQAWSQAEIDWTEKYGREEFLSPGGWIILEADEETIRALARRDGVSIKDKQFWTDRYQNTANYRYWRTRATAEKDPVLVKAHRELYEGRQLFRDLKFRAAREKLWTGMELYAQALAKYPQLTTEDESIEEGLLAVIYWQETYDLLLSPEPPPEDFPLKALWQARQDHVPSVREDFRVETHLP